MSSALGNEAEVTPTPVDETLTRLKALPLWYRLSTLELSVYLMPLLIVLFVVVPLTSLSTPLAALLTVALPTALAWTRTKSGGVTNPRAEYNRGVWHTWGDVAQTEATLRLAVVSNFAFLAGIGAYELLMTTTLSPLLVFGGALIVSAGFLTALYIPVVHCSASAE